ncbi:MAG: methylamine dehydrogenase (amicyanin) light chain, partial [Gammaproteobacteria bacterium]|nr:methylamine dehydrogenase (amicyanin) light chain [Gammaproteobacteria bacterium]
MTPLRLSGTRASFDALVERMARGVARRTSRRRFLGSLGSVLFAAAAVPLLPVARGESPPSGRVGGGEDPGDPQSCDYWRHCAIDGFLCSCCGG